MIYDLCLGKKATGWMIILGDGIHNFADGLAIGAAFSEDLMLGLTTTIAVGCHELPHEFGKYYSIFRYFLIILIFLGDYAVLINSGFSHCSALFWNFISATTAFIGFFVGAAVSTNESTRQWIFAVTIGMFLYIALVDLVNSTSISIYLEFLFLCFILVTYFVTRWTYRNKTIHLCEYWISSWYCNHVHIGNIRR